jgi:hypothetical protein
VKAREQRHHEIEENKQDALEWRPRPLLDQEVQERSKSHNHCDGKANAEIVRVDPVRRRADGDIADILMHEVERIAHEPDETDWRRDAQARPEQDRRADRKEGKQE